MAIVNSERDAIESVIANLKQDGVKPDKIWPNELPSGTWHFAISDDSDRDPQEAFLLGISEPREIINYPERVALFGLRPIHPNQPVSVWRDDVETCRLAMLVRCATKEELQRVDLRLAVVNLQPVDRCRNAIIFQPTDHSAFYNSVI